mgnify:FL=1
MCNVGDIPGLPLLLQVTVSNMPDGPSSAHVTYTVYNSECMMCEISDGIPISDFKVGWKHYTGAGYVLHMRNNQKSGSKAGNT